MNLSAPFIPQFFKSQVDEILPYVDVLIGNESEAQAYADSHDWNTKDISEIALKLSASEKISSLPRLVVITQGAESTIVASTETGKATVYPVSALSSDAIVDTNGAGDAFAGGFLGARAIGKSVDEAIEVRSACSSSLPLNSLTWARPSSLLVFCPDRSATRWDRCALVRMDPASPGPSRRSWPKRLASEAIGTAS